MFKVFRKIRQSLLSSGSTVKYISYAIGEIILVVIGIFIAIQANNWNVERISQKELNQTLEKVLVNLKQDDILLNLEITYNESIVRNLDSSLVILKNPDDYPKANLTEKLFSINQTSSMELVKISFNNLSETGKLQTIRNEALIDSLINYYNGERFLNWEDAIINHTREIIRPYLMGFDFVPLNSEDLGYLNDASQFTIPPKSIKDYASDARIVNGIRFKIFLHSNVTAMYQVKLEENQNLRKLIEKELGRD